jgi:hypothetical protein
MRYLMCKELALNSQNHLHDRALFILRMNVRCSQEVLLIRALNFIFSVTVSAKQRVLSIFFYISSGMYYETFYRHYKLLSN